MLPGHGFAFVFLPSSETNAASSAQYLGIVNFTNNSDPNNRIFAVEFDVFANEEFNDNHVGVDVNSLTSVSSAVAGFWRGERFTELRLNNGDNYQAWIEFNGSAINVTMARAGSKKPVRPLINIPLNLSGVLVDDMFVSFTAATGQLVQSHRILSWSFSNSNFSIGDALITENVLLDKDMNARVGDFGLAKLQNAKKEMVNTTHVVGTAGYMAPELVKTGRASAQTDVYSFGVFVLEVVCGRRPIEEGREGIVEWMLRLMERDRLLDSLDERIKEKGSFEAEKVEMALRLGMFCVHHDPKVRPTMRQVVQILEEGRLSDDGDERERESMEVSLLERMKSSYLLGIGEGRQKQQQHPTFQDVWNSYPHSKFFESSDSIFQGR